MRVIWKKNNSFIVRKVCKPGIKSLLCNWKCILLFFIMWKGWGIFKSKHLGSHSWETCKEFGWSLQPDHKSMLDHKFLMAGCPWTFSLGSFPGRTLSRIFRSPYSFHQNTEYVTETQICNSCLAPFWVAFGHTSTIFYVLSLGNCSHFYFFRGFNFIFTK